MAATDYDFLLTRNELINEAYRKIGDLSDGNSASSEQVDTANKKLNLIIKALGEDGVHLFTNINETLSLVASTQNYAIPTDNGLSIVDKCYVVDGNNDYNLERITFHQFKDIYSKSDAGRPYLFSQDPSDDSLNFYPVPQQAYTVKILGIRKLKDWDDPNDTGEFPARWINTLKYALAVELAEDASCPISQITYFRGIAQVEYMRARGKESNRSDCRYMKGAY